MAFAGKLCVISGGSGNVGSAVMQVRPSPSAVALPTVLLSDRPLMPARLNASRYSCHVWLPPHASWSLTVDVVQTLLKGQATVVAPVRSEKSKATLMADLVNLPTETLTVGARYTKLANAKHSLPCLQTTGQHSAS